MIPTDSTVVSPEQWADRSCKGLDVNVFFPGKTTSAEAVAKRVCAGCPRLRECADWAQGAGLTYGVVAGVRMPGDALSRRRALDALSEVAETGVVPGLRGARRGGGEVAA